MLAKMEATRQIDREERKDEQENVKGMMEEIMTRVNHETQSLQKACKETMACQETTEACLECKEPASDKMEYEVEHQEAPEEDAIVKPVEGRKKRHRGRLQGDMESQRN
jgi:hypothetical protein